MTDTAPALPVPAQPLSVTETAGIRRFDDPNIQSAIDRALKALPSDRKVAAVAHANLTGVSLSLVTRLGGDWSVAASCYKPYAGKLVAAAEVVWSPF